MDAHTRKIINEAKAAADKVLSEERLNSDAREAINSLLIVADMAEGFNNSQVGQTADSRLMKRKFDALKTESTAEKKKFEIFKTKLIETIASEFKVINTQISGILQRHTDSDDPDKKAAEDIRAAIQRVIGSFKS